MPNTAIFLAIPVVFGVFLVKILGGILGQDHRFRSVSTFGLHCGKDGALGVCGVMPS